MTEPNDKRTGKTWIQTFTGRKFYPLDPRPEEIDVRDIARALSMLCRYNGHVSRFYSVAEHSCRVAWRVLDLTGDKRLAFWGLLHDASEAYLSDVTRPVKRQAALAGYREAERVLQAVICRRFGLPEEMPEVVAKVDLEIVGTEARQLKAPIHPDWPDLPAGIPAASGLGWSPRVAETTFLINFAKLGGVSTCCS